jgi:YjjG family noncanonical pyrimidine nucleotidase
VKYKWLLFDADGTLFDYDKAEAIALRRTFRELGCSYEPRYAEVYRQINGEIWRDFEQGKISQHRLRTRRFELLFEDVAVECDPGAFSTRYLLHLADGTDMIEGAEEVVRRLHGKVGLVLITNGIADVQRPRFASSGLHEYFADLVISEEVGASKPDPRIFDAAFQVMAWPKTEEVLIVGDSLASDIKGGNNYGIDTCWFNPRQDPPTLDVKAHFEIKELRELLALLEVI